MSRICTVCDKRPHPANIVSNANNRVRKWVYPNVHRIRFTLAGNAASKVRQGAVCAKCMKSKKVKKVV